MTDDNKPNQPPMPITRLTHTEARKFFLKETSYCNFDLPTYFSFDAILSDVDRFLEGKRLSDFISTTKPRDIESVNHLMLNNKDGQYAWRPMQLIHPALYVDLVHRVTSASNWQTIVDRFAEFESNSVVECTSIPLRSENDRVDKAEQITNWWLEVEQKSIELSLDFPFLCCTDITDCYGAIYTHSIAWALHTRQVAKAKRHDKTLIGNVIDDCMQDMRYGQTNGIPQGSVLTDFIAEIVLGYADLQLTQALKIDASEFKILRYRDDYRIFTTGSLHAEEILRALTNVMSDLGLKLNSNKTILTTDVVSGSIKGDKLAQIRSRLSDRSIQKHLLIIHQHAKDYPNSGSLATALTKFYRRLSKAEELRSSVLVLASIATDIAFHNPRCYPHIAAIISKLLSFVERNEQFSLAERIRKKIERLPNTGYMQVWLQRAVIAFREQMHFSDPLCRLVSDQPADIWNSDWVSSTKLKAKLKPQKIVDKKTLEKTVPVIPVDEVDLFSLMES